MELHERLKKLRKDKGLSQKELGDIIKVSGAAIGQFENNVSTPSSKVLIELSKVFGWDFVRDVPYDKVESPQNDDLIDMLKQRLSDKDEIIALLKKQLENNGQKSAG